MKLDSPFILSLSLTRNPFYFFMANLYELYTIRKPLEMQIPEHFSNSAKYHFEQSYALRKVTNLWKFVKAGSPYSFIWNTSPFITIALYQT